jgi:hypothetical protein
LGPLLVKKSLLETLFSGFKRDRKGINIDFGHLMEKFNQNGENA